MSQHSNHLTEDDLDRVRRGLASAAETDAVGRHVRECAECQTLADEQLSIVDSAAAFEALFSMEEERGGEVRAPSRRIAWWTAAAAGIAAVLVLIPRPHAPQPESIAHVIRGFPVGLPKPARSAEWDALLAETRTSNVLPFPADIRELARPDTFRGEPHKAGAFPMWPMATAVDEDRPELRWPAVARARYVVVITSAGKELARSDSLTEPHWRVPRPLPRGKMLRWQVRVEVGETTSILPAPPAPPAIFRLTSEREHEEIARAKAEAPDDHLLLGLVHARAGVVGEARRELEAAKDPLAPRMLEQLPKTP